MRQTRMGLEPERPERAADRQSDRAGQGRVQNATEPTVVSRVGESSQPQGTAQTVRSTTEAEQQPGSGTGRTRAIAQDREPATEREHAWQRIQREAPEHAAFLEAMRQTFGRIQLQHFTLGNERIWP